MIHKKLITEIRYVPDPSFLDKRGSLAKQLINKDFQNWLVLDNTIQISNKNGNIFASYANLGFNLSNEMELTAFINEIDEILKFLGDLPPVRWGVRVQQLIPSKANFSTLVDKYKSNFLNFKPATFSKIQGDLTDLAVNYVFKKEHTTYHLQSGPMEDKQAEGIFQKTSELPDKGIYIDLDIYREQEQFYKDDFRRARITSFIKDSFKEADSIIKQFEEDLNGK